MQDIEMNQASRPQFNLERLADRLLLSAVLVDGSEVIDEVLTEEVPADEHVDAGDAGGEIVVPEGAWADLMFYTMGPADGEVVDPMPDGGDDGIVWVDGEEVIVCTFGGMSGEGEILDDSAETVPDEVLMASSGSAEEEAGVALAATIVPEQVKAPAAPVDAVSSELLGSSDDLLGGGDSLL